VLKVGCAAPWVTSLASAERPALEDAPLEDVPEPLDDAPVPAGAELADEEPDEELLDEQATSMSAAAVIASADARRLARRGRRVPPRCQ
jgi:hypothetical protein